MGCSMPSVAASNQLSSEKGGGILQRDVQAVGVFFLGLAWIVVLATGGVMGFLMCCAAIWVVLKIRSEL